MILVIFLIAVGIGYPCYYLIIEIIDSYKETKTLDDTDVFVIAVILFVLSLAFFLIKDMFIGRV